MCSFSAFCCCSKHSHCPNQGSQKIRASMWWQRGYSTPHYFLGTEYKIDSPPEAFSGQSYTLQLHMTFDLVTSRYMSPFFSMASTSNSEPGASQSWHPAVLSSTRILSGPSQNSSTYIGSHKVTKLRPSIWITFLPSVKGFADQHFDISVHRSPVMFQQHVFVLDWKPDTASTFHGICDVEFCSLVGSMPGTCKTVYEILSGHQLERW